MGTDAETSTSRETPNEPSSKNERACHTKARAAVDTEGLRSASVLSLGQEQ